MRKPRETEKDAVYHVRAIAHRNEFIFDRKFIKWMMIFTLIRARRKYKFTLNNFSIMGNHIHLMIKPENGESISKIMQWILSVFSKRFNKYYGYKGSVWRCRFKSSIVRGKKYYKEVFRYIANNPVKAGMVDKASDYIYGGIFFIKKSLFSLIAPLDDWTREVYNKEFA